MENGNKGLRDYGQRDYGTTKYGRLGIMRDYTKIEAWQFADDLTVSLYFLTRDFPREELYGITSQLRRAASSVAANIV